MPDPSAVITNTSPLLYLHQVGYLNILQQLYRTVLIPPAVRQELETGRRKGLDVPDINSLAWIQVRPVASAKRACG